MADFDAGPPLLHTYIAPDTIKGTTVAILLLATSVAAARTVVRYRRFKRLYVDDGFLCAAVVSAIAGTALFYVSLDGVFVEANTAAGVDPVTANFPDIFASTNTKIGTVASLLWLSVFAVKFSFLSFFYKLISHSQRLRVWWWCCVVICVPLAIANMIVPWIVCPSYKPIGIRKFATIVREDRKECSIPKNVKGSTVTLEYGFAFDILSDILVISIPIILLRNSRSLHLRQKAILGFMLCLSIFLVIIAVFRFISTQPHVSGVWAFAWYLFWGDIQASIAIILVSATVSKTLFNSQQLGNKRAPRMNNQLKSWSPDGSPATAGSPTGFSPRRWLWCFPSKSSMESDMQQQQHQQVNWEKNPLPSIPHAATMTGIRTMIHENMQASRGSFEALRDDSISSIEKPSPVLSISTDKFGRMNGNERDRYNNYV
ncbi:hypothetical protein MMC11_008566 [Xylographa trunciseda]|nr:hypothetical protein [Xylographa trunciseda]